MALQHTSQVNSPWLAGLDACGERRRYSVRPLDGGVGCVAFIMSFFRFDHIVCLYSHSLVLTPEY
jgi:hypothetical protein